MFLGSANNGNCGVCIEMITSVIMMIAALVIILFKPCYERIICLHFSYNVVFRRARSYGSFPSTVSVLTTRYWAIVQTKVTHPVAYQVFKQHNWKSSRQPLFFRIRIHSNYFLAITKYSIVTEMVLDLTDIIFS